MSSKIPSLDERISMRKVAVLDDQGIAPEDSLKGSG
jgi:hypothetical protein